MGVRAEQKEKRRWQILYAALDLFIRKGYAATKISDIAKQVGMSVGLLFHYFKSKESLYEQLVEIGVAGPMGMMEPTQEPPLLFFERTAEQLLHHLRIDSFTAKMFVLMERAFYDEGAPDGVKERLKGFDVFTPTVALMRKGQEQGSIREGDPAALCIAYWCAIQGIAEQLAIEPETPCPKTEWIIDIIRRR